MGLLYTNVPNTGSNNNNGQTMSDNGQNYNSGIPSPPNDIDGSQRGQYAGSESGKILIFFLIERTVIFKFFYSIRYGITKDKI